ncbi:MAG: hypothetical protein IT289_11135 [Oligoflexia bacterium]|nr:hypothetical protein [Oligoflexia bacterium]
MLDKFALTRLSAILLSLLLAQASFADKICQPSEVQLILRQLIDSIGPHTKATVPIKTCPHCSDSLYLGKNGRAHSEPHFMNAYSGHASLESQLGEKARDGLSTTVFSPEISVDDVIDSLKKPSSFKLSRRDHDLLNSLPKNLDDADKVISAGGGKIAFEAEVLIKGETYQVRVVSCQADQCVDGLQRSYSKGEIISLIPICGPSGFKVISRRSGAKVVPLKSCNSDAGISISH